MDYKLSILLPTIRTERLLGLYDSIRRSVTKESWEIICVGPYPIPKQLLKKPNVKYIQDWGSPTRCRQISLLHAEGEWMCYAGDDVLFLPNALDTAYSLLQGGDYKTAVLGKFTEGKRDNPKMLRDEYYTLNHHAAYRTIQQFLPKEYYIFMSGLVSTHLIKELGGWDCRFEVCAMSCMDLSMRLQNYGLEILKLDEPLFHASHSPGIQGDHGPVHHAQLSHDEPLFREMYSSVDGTKRAKIDIDNWQNSSPIWERRFGRRLMNIKMRYPLTDRYSRQALAFLRKLFRS